MMLRFRMDVKINKSPELLLRSAFSVGAEQGKLQQ